MNEQKRRPLTDTERKQNIVFTFVAAFGRMQELKYDPNKYEAEEDELKKLLNWWDNILTQTQRDKIEKCVRTYGSTDTGTPQHREESQLILMCTYGRMCQLRNVEHKSHEQSEESKRLEYEWSSISETDLAFQVVTWIKAYFAHYDHPLMLEQI